MHRFARKIAIALLAISPALLAACNSSKGAGGGGNNDVAATVNGKNITLKDVDTYVSQQSGGQQGKMSPLETATARLQVLDGLIQQEVLFQRAEKEKLLPSEEEVTQAINGKKLEANLTEDEYQKMLKESGQTEQQLRETARKQLAIQKLLDRTVSSVTISDNEVDSFYNNNKERFVSPRGVALSVIVADPSDSAGQYQDDAKSDPEAQAKINNIYAQLKGGADFATVARQRSEDASGARSGDFGFWDEARLKQGGVPQEVVASLFGSMQPGNFTSPIHLQDGRYFILKLTDRRLQSEPQTLEMPGVRDQIKKALVNERQRILGEALRVVAMNEAKVENNLAQNLLSDPNRLGGMQMAPGTTASPAAAASATPAANAPAGGASSTPAASTPAAATPAR